MVNFSNKVLTHYYLKNTKIQDSKVKSVYEEINDGIKDDKPKPKPKSKLKLILSMSLFFLLIGLFQIAGLLPPRAHLNMFLILLVLLMFQVLWTRTHFFDY